MREEELKDLSAYLTNSALKFQAAKFKANPPNGETEENLAHMGSARKLLILRLSGRDFDATLDEVCTAVTRLLLTSYPETSCKRGAFSTSTAEAAAVSAACRRVDRVTGLRRGYSGLKLNSAPFSLKNLWSCAQRAGFLKK